MYWEYNDIQCKTVINGETQNETQSNANAILLVYAIDFSDKVVKLNPKPILKRELSADEAPCECVLLPPFEKAKAAADRSSSMSFTTNASESKDEPYGLVALVCKDGVVRLLDLSSLMTVTEVKLQGGKFVSAAYCTRKFISLHYIRSISFLPL